MNVDELTVGIKFDQEAFKASADNIQQTLDKLSSNITNGFKLALEAVTSIFGLDFARNMIDGFMSAGIHIEALSQLVRANVHTLGLWEEAIKRVGGTAQGFDASLTSFHAKMAAAAVHSDQATLNALNILQVGLWTGQTDSAGHPIRKSDIELMREVGQALRKTTPDIQYTFGKQLLGDDYTYLLFTKPQAEIDALLTHIDKLGVMTDKQAIQATNLRSKWLDVDQQWKMIRNQTLATLTPDLLKLNAVLQKGLQYLVDHSDLVVDAVEAITAALIAMALVNPFTGWLAVLSGIVALLDTVYNELNKITDHFKKPLLQHNADGTITESAAGKQLFKDTDSFFGKMAKWVWHTTLSDSDVTEDDFKKALANQESSGGKNKIGYKMGWFLGMPYYIRNADQNSPDYFNKIPETYGKYNIKPETASEWMKSPVTAAMLMNDSFSDLVYSRGIAAARAAGATTWEGVAAYWNGGTGGLHHYLSSGSSYHGYAEHVEARAQAAALQRLSHPHIQHGGATQAAPSTVSQNTYNSIGNLHLPSVKNAEEFSRTMSGYGHSATAFSGIMVA